MVKKGILVILSLVIFICLVQFTKESMLNNPQRIYNAILPKYKDLANLSVEGKVYSPKRDLIYALRYMNIVPLGSAQMFVRQVGRNLIVNGVANSAGFINKMYPAQAKVTSIIDKNKFYPLKYTETLTLPEKTKEKIITYDQDNHIMHRKGKKYKIPPFTFGPISMFYYLQIQDLEIGKEHVISMASKEDVYLFKMKVVEKKGNIFKLSGEVRRRNRSSRHGADLDIWICEDLRIPLLFKVKTQAGTLIIRAIK